jgi:calcineurin-like phosphoesterase family protein
MNFILDAVKLTATDTHNVHFVSDTHFGHDRDFIYKKRGYDNVLAHDAGIIDNWNRRVAPNDTVVHCGDVMFGVGGAERFKNYLRNLNFGCIYLMPGNHHAGYRQFMREIQANGNFFSDYLDGNAEKEIYLLPNYAEFYVNGQAIVVSHYPIASWNSMGKGSWCICGHTHGSFHGSKRTTLDGGKILDVGIEEFGGPVSIHEIYNIMETKPVKIVDHHDDKTSSAF